MKNNLRSSVGTTLVLSFLLLNFSTYGAVDRLDPRALEQIRELQKEKESRTPLERKLDSQLIYALKKIAKDPLFNKMPALRANMTIDANGLVIVDISAKITDDLLNAITGSGGKIISSVPAFDSLRAAVKMDTIPALANSPDVKFIRRAVKFTTNSRSVEAGSVTSQGDTTHRADLARSQFGVNGSGVKVGVISDSVDFLSASQASGDLPSKVVVLTGQSGVPGSGEGTAMLEIVHDLAPGAELYFATAFGGPAGFAQNILNLRAAGCDIIVDDVIYFNESPFQDGVIARAVNTVTDNGALYFSSAGNSGNKNDNTSGTWEGDFVDGGPADPVVGGGSTGVLHSFGGATYNAVTPGGSSRRADLFWADPLGGSTNDYDLYVLDSSGANVVSSSTTVQNGSQDPYENVDDLAVGERLVIVKAASAAPRFLHLDSGRGRLQFSTDGCGRGHAAATNSFSTAAVDVHTAYPNPYSGGSANPVEKFSTDGPRRVFFHANGQPITPGDFSSTGGAVRQKPDIAAADGGDTSVPGFKPFYGTSAAAPHAAAIAALVKSYNQALTASQIRTLLKSTALDIEAVGVDRDSGSGIVMAFDALQGVPTTQQPAALLVLTNQISGGNGNGVVDPNECNFLSLVLTNRGTAMVTRVEATVSSATPGVTVLGGKTSFADVPPNSTATSTTPIRLSTSPSFICGSLVQLVVLIKSDQEITTNQLDLATSCSDGGGVCPAADLSIAMRVSPVQVIVGSDVTYSITVSNRGPSSPTVTVNHSLPSTVIFVSATSSQGGCSYSGGTVTCNLSTLPAGAVASIVVVARPIRSGSLVSSATVTSSQEDFDLNNNSVTVVSQAVDPTADLQVFMTANPNPVLVNGSLTYSVAVTNNGPSTATGVTLTNVLPPTAGFVSASLSQGSYINANGTIICNFGNIPAFAGATADIVVRPISEGIITARASVSANQPDPVPGNNSASIATTVSPSCDLALSIVDFPDPVVTTSNYTYFITVTNYGPSTATSVVMNDALPASGVTYLSNSVSQGAVTRSGNLLTWNAGTLASGASASLNIFMKSTTTRNTFQSSGTVSADQVDPNTNNNAVTIMTTVTNAFIRIAAAGATLKSENGQINGAVDFGETVTLDLSLQNVGNVGTTNVVATLLATGGVNSPSGAQSYGSMAPSGSATARSFTFTAPGSGSNVVATLQLQDGANNLGTVTFTFQLPTTTTFTNAVSIAIPDVGNGSPYPSLLTISNLTGLVSKATVTLASLSHSFPDDLDILLVGPGGQKAIVMSDDGGANSLSGATFTLDDTAPDALPDEGAVALSVYKPADYDPGETFPNAPAGPYSSSLSVFNGTSVNGTWSLYVLDDTSGDAGNIAGGWRLTVTTVTPVNKIADLVVTVTDAPDPVLMGQNITYTFTITNSGPDTANGVAFTNILPAGLSFVSGTVSPAGTVSAAGNVVTASLGTLPVGTNVVVTVVANSTASGTINNTGFVSATEVDLNSGNSSATAITTVNPLIADLGVTLAANPNPVTVGSNLTYTVAITNNGSQAAVNSVLSDLLSSSLTVVSVTPSQGTFSVSGQNVTCSLGTINSASTATVVIVVTPTSTGTVNNTVTVSTASSDTSAANNSATASVQVIPPSPQIVVAGVILNSESSSPANGTLDPGETVNVSFVLRNVGAASAANLVATLQSSGGVTSFSSAQNYGAMAPGTTASRAFSFSGNGGNGGVATATLQLQDGANNLGSVTYSFYLPSVTTFANNSAVSIPQSGPADTYPSVLNVSGLSGIVGKVVVTLNGLAHTFPDDLDILLVNPAGQKVMLVSDAGGAYGINNVGLTLSDSAPSILSDAAQITTGSYKPTDYESGDTLASPAPLGPYSSQLSALNGGSANGAWSLYVFDDAAGDSGNLSGGWSLAITTIQPINPAPRLISTGRVGNQFQFSMTGLPGTNYVVQASTNLIDWLSISTNTAASNGAFQFAEPGTLQRRFYRALRAP